MSKPVILSLFIFLSSFFNSFCNIDSLKNILLEQDEHNKAIAAKRLSIHYLPIDFDSSIHYAQLAIEFSEQSSNDTLIATSYLGMGNIHYKNSRYNEALSYYIKAIKTEFFDNHPHELMNLHTETGVLYYYTSSYEKSLNHYLKAVKIAKELKDTMQMAALYNNIGLLYYVIEDFQKARENYTNALKIFTKYGQKQNQALALINIGNIFLVKSNSDSSLLYYETALNLATELDDYHLTALCYHNLGTIQNDLGNTQQALDLFIKAFDRYYIGKSYFELGNISCNIATIYLEQKKFKDSFKYLAIAKEMSEITGSKKLKLNYLDTEAYYYEETKDFEKAYRRLFSYMEVRDSVISEENNRLIAEMENKLLLKEKEKENEVLKKQNEIQELEITKSRLISISLIIIVILLLIVFIAIVIYQQNKIKKKALIEQANSRILEQNKRLYNLNAEKNRFFSIISHDIKNPLSAIVNFSTLISEELATLKTEEVKKYLSYIEEGAFKINSLLDNLLKWASSQSDKINQNPKPTSLKEVISKTLNLLEEPAKAKGISFITNLSENNMVIADTNQIYTILRNLVDNAIKYSPDSESIIVQTIDNGNMIQTNIQDNGIGMNEEELHNLFKLDKKVKNNPLIKEDSGTGLGLILSKEFIESNNGEIWATSYPGKGCVFSFTLPKEVSRD